MGPWTIESSDRKSTRLNSSHANISYAVFCLKKKISRGILNGIRDDIRTLLDTAEQRGAVVTHHHAGADDGLLVAVLGMSSLSFFFFLRLGRPLSSTLFPPLRPFE